MSTTVTVPRNVSPRGALHKGSWLILISLSLCSTVEKSLISRCLLKAAKRIRTIPVTRKRNQRDQNSVFFSVSFPLPTEDRQAGSGKDCTKPSGSRQTYHKIKKKVVLSSFSSLLLQDQPVSIRSTGDGKAAAASLQRSIARNSVQILPSD